MILERLVEYADREGLGQDQAFGVKTVRWQIELDSAGRLLTVLPLGFEGKKHHGKPLSTPETPQNELQAGGRSNFLVDSAECVLSWLKDDKKKDKVAAKHEYFWKLVREYADWALAARHRDAASIHALVAALGQAPKVVEALKAAKAKNSDYVVFAVASTKSTDWPSVQEFWKGRRPSNSESLTPMPDLASGKISRDIATIHGKIRGIRGANPVGASLVSNDKQAFQSFGLESGINAPVSQASEAKYRAALNNLVREGHPLQGSQVCFWSRKKLEIDPWKVVAEADENAVRALYQSAESGDPGVAGILSQDEFYALVVSGVGGRVMIRSWVDSTLGSVCSSLRKWFDDLSLFSVLQGAIVKSHKLFALLYALVRGDKLEDLPPQMAVQLLECALAGNAPPQSVLPLALRRQAVSMVSGRDPDALGKELRRMALIKLCLLRSRTDPEVNHMMKPELDSGQKDPAYLCGRLLAVMDRLQYLALGDVGAGVVERTYGAASATPGLVFGRLFRGAQAHLSKCAKEKPGAAVNVGKDFEEICSRLTGWPSVLNLEEQARFALGFYHQKSEYRRRNAENKKGE